MAKIVNYTIEDTEELSDLGKALSSPIRIEILQMLYNESLIIAEIAKRMNLPPSSTAFHLKILEKAGLVRLEEQPGTRGATKLCSRKVDRIYIDMVRNGLDVLESYNAEMPVGSYSSCEIYPTCGLFSTEGAIGMEDKEYSFYLPERFQANMLWSSAGYVEYQFANLVPQKREIKKLSLRMEICSEAPGYREDWMSDITVWVNNKDCGTWTSPGDFGKRRGRLTPSWCANGSSQYGLMTVWEISSNGSYINGKKSSDVCISDLNIMQHNHINVRIGNKPDAKYVGGFVLFGKCFGDYNQDLILNIEYQ